MTKQKKYLNKAGRWALFILIILGTLAICTRIDTTGGDRDHFRGVNRVYE